MPPAFDEPVVCPVLIGRDDQLDALRQVAASVATGSGQTVLVAGEAGIGKSRLVREFAERLGHDGWVVQQGNCFERDRLLPYAPFLDELHALLTILPPAEVERCLGPALPDLARLLPELGLQSAETAGDPEQEKRRVFYALGGVQSRLAARQPLLLVIEDLHWADDTSLELLAVLARRVPRERILLLGTYRDDEVSGGLAYLLDELDRSRLAVKLRLTRFGRDEVAAMLRAILEPDRPARQARLLSEALRRLAAVVDRSRTVLLFGNRTLGRARNDGADDAAGGRALRFYASVRVQLTRREPIRGPLGVVGGRVDATTVKNKLAPPLRTASLELVYGKGFVEP